MEKHTPTLETDDQPIHTWFGLTYASYLVLPRSVLQTLSVELQQQLVNALEAMGEHLYPASIPVRGEYAVQVRGTDGRFISDPLRDYQRGRRRVAKVDLIEMSTRQ